MAKPKKSYIANQIFIGLPWKNVRPKYDRIIPKLEKKYPLHFAIVGRNDGQDAQHLFEIIKNRISESSFAVFDATSGNANVSLEYGYAEGLDVPRAIFLSDHKAANKGKSGNPIISDLSGQRRVHYKTEKALLTELEKTCRTHAYTVRFEKALKTLFKRKGKGGKKSGRALALKIIRQLDGKQSVRRADLTQNILAQGYTDKEINDLLKSLHLKKIITCSVGRYADVSIK